MAARGASEGPVVASSPSSVSAGFLRSDTSSSASRGAAEWHVSEPGRDNARKGLTRSKAATEPLDLVRLQPDIRDVVALVYDLEQHLLSVLESRIYFPGWCIVAQHLNKPNSACQSHTVSVF